MQPATAVRWPPFLGRPASARSGGSVRPRPSSSSVRQHRERCSPASFSRSGRPRTGRAGRRNRRGSRIAVGLPSLLGPSRSPMALAAASTLESYRRPEWPTARWLRICRPSPDRPDASIGGSVNMRVSVVIPSYNEASRLPATLLRPSASSGPSPPAPGEILVVDDGSRDGTAEIAAGRSRSRHHPSLPYSRDQPGQGGRGQNRLLRRAR